MEGHEAKRIIRVKQKSGELQAPRYLIFHTAVRHAPARQVYIDTFTAMNTPG